MLRKRNAIHHNCEAFEVEFGFEDNKEKICLYVYVYDSRYSLCGVTNQLTKLKKIGFGQF